MEPNQPRSRARAVRTYCTLQARRLSESLLSDGPHSSGPSLASHGRLGAPRRPQSSESDRSGTRRSHAQLELERVRGCTRASAGPSAVLLFVPVSPDFALHSLSEG